MRRMALGAFLVSSMTFSLGGCPGFGEPANPLVTLSIDKTSIREDGGVARVTATLAGETRVDVMVKLAYSGSAESGEDYTRSSTTITIPARETTGHITVRGVADEIFEGDETVVIAIESVSGGTEDGQQVVTLTLTDNDPVPTVELSLGEQDDALSEDPADSVTVGALLSNPANQDVTVTLTFGGTATVGQDYTRSSNQIVISAGREFGAIDLKGVADDVFEDAETIIVTIAAVTVATVGDPRQVTITVQDAEDPANVTLSVSNTVIPENGGTATVTARLSEATALETTVMLAFAGTATLTDDYTRSGTQIIIPAGATTGSITLAVVDDALHETDETIVVSVDSVTGAVEQVDVQVTVTITDDDPAPTVTLAVSDENVPENGGPVTITATLSAPAGTPITVDLNFAGTATGTVDYTYSSDYILISAGQTSGTVTITFVNDTVYEPHETVAIAGFVAGERIGPTLYVMIVNDDPLPAASLSLSAATLTESGGTVVLRANLSNASYQDVTVNLAYSGAAAKDTDYMADSEIVIPAGLTVGVAGIIAIDDALDEADETVVVQVDSVTGGVAGSPSQVTATITDDDGQPSVSLSLSGSPLAENGGEATVTATLSAVSGQDVTVELAFSGTATEDTDYTVSAEQILVPAGQLNAGITITGVDDSVDEDDETVVVDVDSVTNATESGAQQVTATITDDDTAGVLVDVADGVDVQEGDLVGDTYTLVLATAPAAGVTITLTPDTQIDVGSGAGVAHEITFTAATWDQAQTITVTAADDLNPEGPHTQTISHSASSADLDYDGIAISDVTVNVTED